MADEDIFSAMAEEELNQYQKFFLFRERELFRRGKYRELAEKSLRQTRVFGVIVFLNILIFSLISILHFIDFGNERSLASFILGLLSWAFVIASTFFYTKNILEKKKCMERVLKLLEARDQYFSNKS
jgi:uncharacterized SAM-binding protein YcdF (DUF218 family)